MATSFNFNGKNIKIPGVYANIKSGIKNPTLNLPYGNLLIVDTGSGATWGGGAGVNGQLEDKSKAIYEFDNIQDYRNFVKGGIHWLLAEPLFRPSGLQAQGVSRITYMKAAVTTAAEISLSFTGDGGGSESVVNGGDLVIQITDEGVVGNGVLNSLNELTKGYAVKLESGVVDTSKFILRFYLGTYKGLDQNGIAFDGIKEIDSKPELILSSIEFNDLEDLISWMNTDSLFQTFFKLKTSSTAGDASIDDDDLIALSDYQLATGGTEDYSAASNLDDILEIIKDKDISFILSDDWGTDAQSANNLKIANHIANDSKYKPELYIAAGSNRSEFNLSLQTAAYYDYDHITVVHGGIRKITRQGLRLYDSIVHAAYVLGREAGLAPQIPITFKNIRIDSLQHDLTDKEVTQALNAGVLVTRLQDGSFDVVKGINSLQKNDFLVNEDGTTHSKQIRRIARQLNKEIMVNSKLQLLKNPVGVNRNTLSEEDLRDWLIGYLRTKKALPGADNLILDFYDIVVTRNQDAYFVSYKMVPNSEISFLFFEGLIVEI